jgi:serine protease Do
MNLLATTGRRRRLAAAAALCLAALAAIVFGVGPATAQGTLRIDREGTTSRGWQIGLSERFGGCIATTTYTDQTTVWVGLTGESSTAFLAFTNPNWASLEKNREYALQLRGASRNWNGRFVGFEQTDSEKGLVLFGLRKEFILEIARSAGIDVIFERRAIARLSMSGSLSAIETMLVCHQEFAFDPKARDGQQPTRTPRNNEPPRQGEARAPGLTTGTGFFVSPEGHVLTNQHVVENCTSASVIRPGNPPVRANVVGRDPVNDLALLTTGLRPERVPSLSTRVRMGESIYAYGFPLSGLLATTGNFTIGNVSALAGLRDDTRMLQHSAPTQPGNSGGALVDERGNVVGVIVSKLNVLALAQRNQDIAQNVNFAIRAGVASNFLEANGLTVTMRPSEEKLEPSTLADQARDFTVQVVCDR